MFEFDLAAAPTQEVGLLLSIAGFVLVSAAAWMARHVNGAAPASMRLAMYGLWLYALLRLYSASAFIWSQTAGDLELLPVLRLLVLVVITLAVIVSLAIVVYYWRRWRSSR